MAHDREYVWFGPFAILTALLLVVAEMVARPLGRDGLALVPAYLGPALALLPALLLLWVAIRLGRAMAARDPAPTATLIAEARAAFAHPAPLIARVGVLLLMPVAMAALATLKMLLPAATGGFTMDGLLVRADRALFLGIEPWRITHAVLGAQLPTLLIDRLYTLWVPLLAVSTAYFALFAPAADRARFFLTYLGCWTVLGTAGAYLGASAGPCFLAPLGQSDAIAYAGLMDRLHAIDAAVGLGAVKWQAVLWQAHAAGRMEFAMGISAMPSVHVSIATLYVLAARRRGRVPFALTITFGAAILIGSVHLGWHYAVDGIASIAGTILLWRLAGWWLGRAAATPVVATPAAA